MEKNVARCRFSGSSGSEVRESPSKAQREMIPNELCDSDGQLTQSISPVENYWSVHSGGATAANPALPSGATRSARFLGVLKDAEVFPYPISPAARRL